MPPEAEYSLNPRIGMDSLSNREVSVRQRVDQENVGCFMTKAKERELHGGHISSRDLCWNKSWKLECKCLPALVETFPGEGG